MITFLTTRTFFLLLLWQIIAYFIDIPLSSAAILCAIGISALATRSLLRSSLSSAVILLGSVVTTAVATTLLPWVGSLIPSSSGSFTATLLGIEIGESLAVAAVCTTTSVLLARHNLAQIIEGITIALVSIGLLSRHQEFRFDRVPLVEELAWHLGLSPITSIIFIAIAFSALWIISLVVAPKANPVLPTTTSSGSFFSLPRLNLLLIAIALLSATTWGLYIYFSKASLTRVMNGVGMAEGGKGQSPLNFDSALGATNQPAALVRLEGDYPSNPFEPHLFLREAALSEFDGMQLVQADSSFDTDVSTKPIERTDTFPTSWGSSERSSLVQSIYLLVPHNVPFAADYPIDIRGLKNPNPNRFNAAYRAYSSVLTTSQETIYGRAVGSSTWDKSTWEHYTKPHPDQRYKERAASIVANISPKDKVAQAQALANYLIEESTYTLRPNHNVGRGEDQTAPFLFGDLRGYCVHFSHAMVYMLRALGIPARIGTGYLTDLSQAKDGHLLLRFSDRHAWAEVFLEDLGWVPFDVQPKKIESHADSEVDPQTLEELMGLVGVPEEFEDAEQAKDEPTLQPKSSSAWQLSRIAGLVLPALISILLLLKLYLRTSYSLARQESTRAARAYRAAASVLVDMGYSRRAGETRRAYRDRIASKTPGHLLAVVEPLLVCVYSDQATAADSTLAIRHVRQALSTLRSTMPGRALGLFLSPRSLIHWIGGGSW